MAITLNRWTVRDQLSGQGTIEVVAPKKLRIEGPNGEELFKDGPAQGKKWVVRLFMDIVETDV